MPLPSSSVPPNLLASTLDTYQSSIEQSHDREEESLSGSSSSLGKLLGNGLSYRSQTNAGRNPGESNSFRSAEWTPDGTCLVTNSEDNCLRTFIVPPDLLEPRDAPLALKPYCITPHPSTIYCHAVYPFFKLDEPSTCYSLVSTKNHPLQLRSLLASTIAASYPLIHNETEKYLTPSSLVWAEDGIRFYAGTDSLVSVFDSSRYGSAPVRSLETGSKKRRAASGGKRAGNSGEFGSRARGIVSALDVYGGILALGTYTRWVSLYDEERSGEVVDSFNLKETDRNRESRWEGKGITNVRWDRSRTYLYISERRCNVVRIYDVRKPGQICGYLVSAASSPESNQKFGFDIGSVPAWAEHPIVVSGSAKGVVDVWTHEQEEPDPYGRDLEQEERSEDRVTKPIQPSGGWQAHSDPVTSAAIHPTGCVVATCSGERKLKLFRDDASDTSRVDGGDDDGKEKDSAVWDNSLKIWSI